MPRRGFAREAETRAPAKDGQHQPPVRRGGISPHISQGAEARPLVGNGLQGVQQVERRAGRSVESRHQHHIARVERVDHPAKLDATALRPARHFAVHLRRSGGGQRAGLRLDALAVRGDPCIPKNRAPVMRLTYGKENPFRINGLDFFHKS